MKVFTKTLYLILLAILSVGFVNAEDISFVDDGCYDHVSQMPVSCEGGTLDVDTLSGGCRILSCVDGPNSLHALACGKPDIADPKEFFEVYKTAMIGDSPLTLCVGDACVGENGFAQSDLFPICPDEVPVCGNGIIEGDETCELGLDAADYDSLVCENCQLCMIPYADYAEDYESIDCDAEILTAEAKEYCDHIDIPFCEPVCGNGIVEIGEECDGELIVAGKGELFCNEFCEIEEPSNEICVESVCDVPVDCDGEVIFDSCDGTCRSIICEDGSDSVEILACEKPDDADPKEYFEMYKTGESGVTPEVCLGDACIQYNGYARSEDFPICFEEACMIPYLEYFEHPGCDIVGLSASELAYCEDYIDCDLEWGLGTEEYAFCARPDCTAVTGLTTEELEICDPFYPECDLLNLGTADYELCDFVPIDCHEPSQLGVEALEFCGFDGFCELPYLNTEAIYLCEDDIPFCDPVCGNGIVEIGEECDGELTVTEEGTLFCNEFCEIEEEVCMEEVEVCEMLALADLPATCEVGEFETFPGIIDVDETTGDFRYLECEDGDGNRIFVDVFYKYDDENMPFIEMHATRNYLGNPHIELCLGEVCVDPKSNGFATGKPEACHIEETECAMATLVVNKIVVNDNGGDGVVEDWDLMVSPYPDFNPQTIVDSGEENMFEAGDYVVHELLTAPLDFGYLATFSGDCDENGDITLEPGDYKVCNITNDDIPMENESNETNQTNQTFDFGDLGSPYPTLLADNGARHVIDGVTYLGPSIDADADGQPSVIANGDDTDGTDDEDGVIVFFGSRQANGEVIDFRFIASAPGFLNAWFDFNADGDFTDAGEKIIADAALVAGTNQMNITLPEDLEHNSGRSRFRFSTIPGLSYDGLAPNGEVEDYYISLSRQDFGDAPDSYDTLRASNGARHTTGGPTLGTSLSGRDFIENDGQPSVGADGDDTDGNDDENGVTVPVLVAGTTQSISADVFGGSGFLNAWFDFNADGDFLDAGEHAIVDAAVSTGANAVNVTTPMSAVAGSTYARFRIASGGGLVHNGFVAGGEVEDHVVTIEGNNESNETNATLTVNKILINDNGGTATTDAFTFNIFDDTPTFIDNIASGQTISLPPGTYKFTESTAAEFASKYSFIAIGGDCDQAGNIVLTAGQNAVCTATNDDIEGAFNETNETNFTISANKVLINDDGAMLTEASFGWTVDEDGIFPYTHHGVSFGQVRSFPAGEFRVLETFFGPGISAQYETSINCTNATEISGEGGSAPRYTAEAGVHVYCTVVNNDWPLDFGDAPDGDFKTLRASDGARHALSSDLKMGLIVDAELDGAPSIPADGDDTIGIDDEDGVSLPTTVAPGDTFPISIDVASVEFGAYINGWMDFYVDSEWLDAGEHIIVDFPVSSDGTYDFNVTVPGDAVDGIVALRFRVAHLPGADYFGLEASGEVEDYIIIIDSGLPPPPLPPPLV